VTAQLLLLFAPVVVAANEPKDVPETPVGFAATLFAREPLVRHPSALAFDARGRLFVGMGPQFRNPRPETPGDSIVIVLDTDGDGVADTVKVFATGFNCIQGLAWHGRDLWVANSPDLTIVRDLDGDDEADEYVRVYTDLGNLEHGLHGLNWAPDGKLYMSKGNSKGLTLPGRIAPRPFRELMGVKAPPDAPDFPPPTTYRKGEYKHAYHDPADDWGRDGGILRCDDGGHNLEIVARGFRNPWDITPDSGFNWLGTDNDQVGGDRVFMPFFAAHFGWNHPWSSHWSDAPHPPTAPVSGPLFEGSGTGIIYYDAPQFPPEYRNVFFINDWLRKTTFLWRPTWDGALLRPVGGDWQPFARKGQTNYSPTDIEVGPDGALWVLGWGNGYGSDVNKDGKYSSAGRVFRIAWKDAPAAVWKTPRRARPLAQWTVSELLDDFAGPLPVWRSNAQDELVRRGKVVKAELLAALRTGKLTQSQETWTAWTLGRIVPDDAEIAEYFTHTLAADSPASLNLRIQAVRILAHRVREFRHEKTLPNEVASLLRSREPRLRFAAVQAILHARQEQLVPQVLNLLAEETDRTTFYAAWQTLRALSSTANLQQTLVDSRGGVRRAALLALLETHAIKKADVLAFVKDSDAGVQEVVGLVSGKAVRGTSQPKSTAYAVASPGVVPVKDIKTRSLGSYRLVAGGLHPGANPYTDRDYTLKAIPRALQGADFLQTANGDDGSRGDDWLSFEALLPLRVHVALDTRQSNPPAWLRQSFRPSETLVNADHWNFQLYTRDYPAGPVQLGGNTDDGKGGGKGNYIVVLEALPLSPPPSPATIDEAIGLLPTGNAARGEALFHHRSVGCVTCHRLGQRGNVFAPDLSSLGNRAAAKHIVESMLEPNAIITEGFKLQLVETRAGTVHSGILLEETGLTLTLGLASGERLVLDKDDIETRSSSNVSGMPPFAAVLQPQHVADLAAYLLTQKALDSASPKKTGAEAVPNANAPARQAADGFAVEENKDRLTITHSGRPVAEFVFRDERILRPYFANVHTANAIQVTRNHPPRAGDAADHDTMHPGIWLGFGDISGVDFWRNRGRIEHVRFSEPPAIKDGQVHVTQECRLLGGDKLLGTLTNRLTWTARPFGWLLVWDATFRAAEAPLTFGDQEEMGFGARLATPFTEKASGQIVNSAGQKTAKATWGQPAAWCDYAGHTDGKPAGITLMPHPDNFRGSWWHNRDYGVFVANPFGRSALRQGARSSVAVQPGESFRIRFGAALHHGADYDPASAFRDFAALAK